MVWVIVIIVAVVVLILAYIAYLWNKLVRYRNRVENAWHQIDVQLNRRADLIPNLVETVKGYAAHEKSTFEMVTKARAALMGAGSVGEKAQAEGQLAGALKSLFAVAEAYPELKANQNFLALQEELTGTENKIAYARQFYNDSVMAYDIARQ
jgi:LemA protein